jgi:hypothetical protein
MRKEEIRFKSDVKIESALIVDPPSKSAWTKDLIR